MSYSAPHQDVPEEAAKPRDGLVSKVGGVIARHPTFTLAVLVVLALVVVYLALAMKSHNCPLTIDLVSAFAPAPAAGGGAGPAAQPGATREEVEIDKLARELNAGH